MGDAGRKADELIEYFPVLARLSDFDGASGRQLSEANRL